MDGVAAGDGFVAGDRDLAPARRQRPAEAEAERGRATSLGLRCGGMGRCAARWPTEGRERLRQSDRASVAIVADAAGAVPVKQRGRLHAHQVGRRPVGSQAADGASRGRGLRQKGSVAGRSAAGRLGPGRASSAARPTGAAAGAGGWGSWLCKGTRVCSVWASPKNQQATEQQRNHSYAEGGKTCGTAPWRHGGRAMAAAACLIARRLLSSSASVAPRIATGERIAGPRRLAALVAVEVGESSSMV